MAPRMAARLRSLWLLALLAGVGVLAWLPRSVHGHAHPYSSESDAWFSRDPDGLYHARRVERAMSERGVAARDPRLNYPAGAPIPWPPYYDGVLAAALAPFAPAEPDARWRWIERATASAPRVFGVLGALLAAVAAWRIGGALAAFVAGVSVALCRGSINYSAIGTGDHHAWVSLLAGAALLALSQALRPSELANTRRSALWGVLLGALCGLLVGSWVASLLYVFELQLVLGWMLWRRSKQELPGLAPLGLALHVTAALTLAPAVLHSPWRVDFPWMVVNLSWFHLALLALGALAFVPLWSRSLGRGTRMARVYPALVVLSLAALALVSWALELAPARGIAEGLEWVARVDRFMDSVQESMPLVGARAEQGVLFLALGYGVLLAPIALGWAAWRAWRHGDDELAPWIIATASLLPQALAQRRFADALAIPMAVLLGLAAARVAMRVRSRWLAAALALAAVLSQWPSAAWAWRRLSTPRDPQLGGPLDPVSGERLALEWIRARTGASDAWSVLAHWDRGHGIEWAANAPSVATNFGSYIGIDSYADPARFFLSEDLAAARALLERRHVRYVYAPTTLMQLVPSMCRIAAPERREQLLRETAQGQLVFADPWYSTMAARMLFNGTAVLPNGVPIHEHPGPPSFLRLVHVTKERHPTHVDPVTGLRFPVAFVWEHVPGARVEVHGPRDTEVELEIKLEFAASGYRVPWRANARIGDDGRATFHVPYATDSNGDARLVRASWRIGAERGALAIPEAIVLQGGSVHVP